MSWEMSLSAVATGVAAYVAWSFFQEGSLIVATTIVTLIVLNVAIDYEIWRDR